MEIVIALIITLLVLGFVGLPLLKEKKPEEVLADDGAYREDELDRLLSQKDTALTAIHELEFDHAVGSLSDDDYRELKERYERKAISLLKTLDEVGETSRNGRDSRGRRRAARAARSRRDEPRQAPMLACPECGEPYNYGDRFCASCGTELDGYEEEGGAVCAECGEPYEEGDAFCASCGADLLPLEGQVERAEEEDGPVDESQTEPGETKRPSQQASGTYHRRRSRRAGKRKSPSGNGREAR